jgi:hypothetical protein
MAYLGKLDLTNIHYVDGRWYANCLFDPTALPQLGEDFTYLPEGLTDGFTPMFAWHRTPVGDWVLYSFCSRPRTPAEPEPTDEQVLEMVQLAVSVAESTDG